MTYTQSELEEMLAKMRAASGKRGQAFFRALVAALDGMPEKRLVEGKLQEPEGAVCALGALGVARGVDLGTVDTRDYEQLGELFDVAPQLIQEVMYMNDEIPGSPERRWERVRKWAARQIIVEAADLESEP